MEWANECAILELMMTKWENKWVIKSMIELMMKWLIE